MHHQFAGDIISFQLRSYALMNCVGTSSASSSCSIRLIPTITMSFWRIPPTPPRRLFVFLTLFWTLPYWTLCYSTKPIPITVLSGFLGSGKTTLLQNLLQNNQGLRIAVIVNDVAAINIDSKLVATEDQAAGMVQLQNGCACCSQAEELLASVAELVTLSDLRGDEEGFDHIVLECSGVADPKGVRAQFQQAALYQMPLLERVQLDTMVTVIDCGSFLDYLKSEKMASPSETPELYYTDGNVPPDDEFPWQDDDDDTIPPALKALLSGGNNQPLEQESVAALLLSQTETADVVLLNKVDLATEQQLQTIQAVVRACCPADTRMHQCTYAAVNFNDILAVAAGQGVVLSGVVDDHREAVRGATSSLLTSSKQDVCHDPGCTQDHAHSHEHAKEDDEHGSHAHSHHHHQQHEDETDHSHSHEHAHDCDDPNCNDPTHNHGTTTPLHAGISTFVYQARRPFHPERLTAFLRRLPIRIGLPPKDETKDSAAETKDPVLSLIVRSKGFCWCADSHRVAYFWSQAGPSFELSKVGAWWATLPRGQWPQQAVPSILADFDDDQHDEANAEGKSVGDRRQEVVLIGSSLGSKQSQTLVKECLDQCLLHDDEWKEYLANRNNEESLRSRFPTPLLSRIMSF